MVPRGLLPAMEIDGKVMTESLDIMYLGCWQRAFSLFLKRIYVYINITVYYMNRYVQSCSAHFHPKRKKV